MTKKKEGLDSSRISHFRRFVNEQHLIFHIYKDFNGKDMWSAICSAMDWIDVAISGIQPSKLIYANTNESSISVMTFINCVDIMWEGIMQLHRVFVDSGTVPFSSDCSAFNTSNPDNDYWKAIRAIFSAHPINLNDITGSRQNTAERWFASWSGYFIGSSGISVFLYSNIPGKDMEQRELDVSSIMVFAQKRYEYLEDLEKAAEARLIEYINKCNKKPIPLLLSYDAKQVANYVDKLLVENRTRWDNDYYNERLSEIKQAFSVDIMGQKNTKVMDGYKKALLTELSGIRDAISNLDYDHQHYEVEYKCPSQYLYACQHIFDKSKRALIQYGVEKMKEYFGDLIDYSVCKDDIEIVVLTRACLWLKQQKA